MQRQTRETLRRMSAEGMSSALMVGAGETYVAAFVLALGFSQLVAGLVSALPLLVGAAMQLVSPYAVRRLGSHRRWVVACAAVQALSFAPLCLGGFAGRLPLALVFVGAALYWGGGLATGPAWNAWVEQLVPARLRTRYFARRSLLAQVSVLAGIVGAGALLQLSSSSALFGGGSSARLVGFGAIFLLAGLARLSSSVLLGLQPEPHPPDAARLTLGSFWRSAREGRSARLLAMMLALQLSVFMAAPYFAPFMLATLSLSYGRYTLLTAAAFVARIAAMHVVGRRARTLSAWTLLRFGSVGIVPMAALWIVSDHPAYLLAIQLVGGVVWGCYELATFLLFFETIPSAQRVSALTWFNAGNASAIVVGAALGGGLLGSLGATRTTYLWLFGVSSSARLLSLLLYPRRGAPRVVEPVPTRVIAVRPGMGGLSRPIVGALAEATTAREKQQ